MNGNPRESLRQRMRELQASSRQLRVESFVDYTPTVCGISLRPITYRTYLHLVAFNNGFVCSGQIDLRSICQFVWVHHPKFGQHAHAARKRVFRRVVRSLQPRFPVINSLALVLRAVPRLRWLRHLVRPTAEERLAAVVADIRQLVHEALHDFPVADGEDDAPPLASYPHFVSLLERSHALTHAEACALVDRAPMKELVQWIREALFRLSKGREKLLSAEEAAVWSEWLDIPEEAPAGN